MANKKWQIPFDRDGNMLSSYREERVWWNLATNTEYTLPYHDDEGKYLRANNLFETRTLKPEMRDDYEFTDTLTLQDFSLGRSAIDGILIDSKGKKFRMNWASLSPLILTELVKGQITGTFGFRKHGAYYSIYKK